MMLDSFRKNKVHHLKINERKIIVFILDANLCKFVMLHCREIQNKLLEKIDNFEILEIILKTIFMILQGKFGSLNLGIRMLIV